MCRIAAYIGTPCLLGDILTAPAHSLHRQSWDAREMKSATVNADGWGAAWLDRDARPAVYREILPIWADVNVDSLCRSLTSPLWLANVRSATPGLGTDHANTQPFCDDALLFTHNGFIDGFAHTLRARLRAELDPAIESAIVGNTDSEYLFALIRQQRGDLAARVRRSLAWIRAQLADTPDVRALLTLIVSDGRTLVATRAAVNGDPPSLYLHPNWQGGVVVASEAFDGDPGWRAIEPEGLIVVNKDQLAPQMQTL